MRYYTPQSHRELTIEESIKRGLAEAAEFEARDPEGYAAWKAKVNADGKRFAAMAKRGR